MVALHGTSKHRPTNVNTCSCGDGDGDGRFNGHTFLPFSSASRQVNVPSDLGSTVFVAVCCVLTLMLSALGFTFLYKFYLRKRLVQKMLKKD